MLLDRKSGNEGYHQSLFGSGQIKPSCGFGRLSFRMQSLISNRYRNMALEGRARVDRDKMCPTRWVNMLQGRDASQCRVAYGSLKRQSPIDRIHATTWRTGKNGTAIKQHGAGSRTMYGICILIYDDNRIRTRRQLFNILRYHPSFARCGPGEAPKMRDIGFDPSLIVFIERS